VNFTEHFSYLLTRKEYASEIRTKINPDQTYPVEYYGILGNLLKDQGSNSVCVVDKDRNAVSLTSSLNYPLGSRIFSNSLGFFLNNQMASFTTELLEWNDTRGIEQLYSFNGINNFIEPGKRPLSSISPALLLKDGSIYLAVASSSGTLSGQSIISSVVSTILDIIDYNLEPRSSVARARCHHQLVPNKIYFEFNYPLSLIDYLQNIGHEVVILDESMTLGGVQVIFNRDDGWLLSASDPRDGGMPVGY